MERTFEYYLALPYTMELRQNEDGTWFARIEELPGCITEGDTEVEALEMLRDAQRAWLSTALEDGAAVPEPQREEEYSGRFLVRAPKSLHRALKERAEREGVSLNLLVTTTLAKAVGERPPAERKRRT